MSVASSNTTTTNRTIHNECATNQLVIVGMDGRKKNKCGFQKVSSNKTLQINIMKSAMSL